MENQCQHASWYFLPWHRMYLYWFEEILRSHMSPDVTATWALPYWNYTDVPARRALPPAFRQRSLPNGGANPLFISQRQRRPLDINAGARLSGATVSTRAVLRPSGFTSSATPPHFHAQYGEHLAQIELATLRVLDGSLPPRALRLIRAWARNYPQELADNWERAQALEPLVPIEPLA